MPLQLQPNFAEPGRRYFRDFSPGDDFYAALLEAQQGLADDQAEAFNARLVLLLSNHIGDIAVLREAFALARRGL